MTVVSFPVLFGCQSMERFVGRELLLPTPPTTNGLSRKFTKSLICIFASVNGFTSDAFSGQTNRSGSKFNGRLA
ncbi:unannotated protein [freshwater metagenome]|uniref:Unannotated protein n=1 Tax=freshwater metagenome TaxID=449393 RepID=A0A6J7UL46_9ZZZZ